MTRQTPAERVLAFDPNSIGDPAAPMWATFIPGRRPMFKTYVQRGHALNSATYAHNFALYRRDPGDGRWVLVHRLTGDDPARYGSRDCDGCGKHVYARRRWVNLDTDSPRTEYLCRDCGDDRRRIAP